MSAEGLDLRRQAIIAFAMATLLGCDRTTSESSSAPVLGYDAPDTVTNSLRGVWTNGFRWQIVEDLIIGAREGPPEYSFFGPLLVNVDLQGRVYVLVVKDAQVRVFDTAGEFLYAFSGIGKGPAEFQAPSGITIIGDTMIAVIDQRLQKLALFTVDGELISTAKTDIRPFRDGWVRRMMALDEGTVVVETFHGWLYPSPGKYDGMGRLIVLGLDGAVVDTFALFGGPAVTIDREHSRHPEIFYRPFAPAVYWGVTIEDHVGFGRSNEYRITEYTKDAEAVRMVRRDVPPRSVSKSDVDVYRDEFPNGRGMDGLNPRDLRWLEDILAQMDMPTGWPAFDAIEYDDVGNLWVRLPGGSTETVRKWDVFDNQRRYLGDVEIPTDLTIHKISANAIYGVSRDELGVPSVKRYLIKQAP